jgi:hypothetical protein
MTKKQELIDSVALNTRKGYLYSIIKLSALFFLIAVVASYFGLTTSVTDLHTISDNTFIAQITFIGFVIVVNERVIEAFKRTFRRRTSEEYSNELKSAMDTLKNTPLDSTQLEKVKIWESIVNDYSTETGRMCLTASLTIGCILGSLGIVNIFGSLENTFEFSSQLHVVLFDGVDVVLTGWVISGGSDGWTGFLNNAKSMFPQKTS